MARKNSREQTSYRIRRVLEDAWSHTALQDTLQVVAEGVTKVAGFGVASISVLHSSGESEVVAVAGNEDARAKLLGTFSPVSTLLNELEVADHWGRLRFVPHERLGDLAVTGWVPDLAPSDDPDAWHPLDLLVAPLWDEAGEIRGFLSVDLPDDGRRPDLERRRKLEMCADQAGRSILRAMERERLAEQVRLADATRQIVRGASAQLDLERIFEDCQRAIVDGFRIQGLWIQTFDQDGFGRGLVYSSDGEDIHLPDKLIDIAIPAARQCWREQRVAIISRRRAVSEVTTPEQRELILQFLASVGVTSVMFVPLGAGPECLGNLVLTRDDSDPEWTDVEATAALDIGHDLGRAMLNARMFDHERRLVDELQQLDRYKGRLIATISHELKNPLTSIAGHAELLGSANLDAGSAASVGAIERGAARLNRLVEDLLLLAKVGDPNIPLIASPVDLGAVIDEVVGAHAIQASSKEIGVSFDRPALPVVASGEAAELERLCTNLLINAVKYTQRGGSVTLSLSRDGAQAVLTCADDGLGISPTDQDRLFTEFFRSTNPAALAVPGTGLGLAISRRIVERHGGEIAVESALGKGTTFTVRLPAVD